MAKAKSTASAAEAKLLKAKDAIEEAKVVLYNAKFDFREAKKQFMAAAKAANKKVLDSITKKGK
jgi:hypothetical protein